MTARNLRDQIAVVTQEPILFDETIRQSAKDGTPLPKLIETAGSIPGIKVDAGVERFERLAVVGERVKFKDFAVDCIHVFYFKPKLDRFLNIELVFVFVKEGHLDFIANNLELFGRHWVVQFEVFKASGAHVDTHRIFNLFE